MNKLSHKQFNAIAEKLVGNERGWQSRLSEMIGMSKSLISQVSKGKLKVSKKLSKAMLDALADDNGIIAPLYGMGNEQNVSVDDFNEKEALKAIEETLEQFIEEVPETDEEILLRIRENFEVSMEFVDNLLDGAIPSVIMSGPPGVGKSYPTMQRLKEWGGDYKLITGGISAPGLYEALYEVSHGGVLILDDVDDVYTKEDALNLLKGALDTTGVRTICWQKQSKWLEAKDIPQSFEFQGSVIFITNKDLDKMVAKDGRISPHIRALMSRSYYMNMGIRTKRDMFLRIKDMVKNGKMLSSWLGGDEEDELLTYVDEKKDQFRDLSLRTMIKLAKLMYAGPRWKALADRTMLK